jgi:ABC-type bacteriocin/lantibiotic exporter with double-glycine peptidase domain
MKRQAKGYWCGVASIANALEVLGIKRSQREIARLCDVSPEAGTNETEMKRALLANGVQVDEWNGAGDSNLAWQWLQRHLRDYGPVILCVQNDEHWVTAIGLCDQVRVIIFDPSRNQGIEVHSPRTIETLWLNEDQVRYGIGVSL